MNNVKKLDAFALQFLRAQETMKNRVVCESKRPDFQ